tara:strand:+ start:338 stop:712 length:375 start_codon:yes stop_codon:yes gene_type:complete
MDIFDNILINLRVLQSLQCHNRLDTTETLFKIHTPLQWIPTWLKRWWASQTRTTDISRIQTLYQNAARHLDDGHPDSVRLREYIKDSRQGLENLRTTYAQDSTAAAKLDVILDSVSHILDPPVP